ncbi:unnamed protein product, partial [Lymnaea stagnalis]
THPRSPPGGRGHHVRNLNTRQAMGLDDRGPDEHHARNLNTRQAMGSDDRGPDDARRPRRTRSAHVTYTRISEDTVRWDIDPPDTGLWSISTTGAETANITIMAV